MNNWEEFERLLARDATPDVWKDVPVPDKDPQGNITGVRLQDIPKVNFGQTSIGQTTPYHEMAYTQREPLGPTAPVPWVDMPPPGWTPGSGGTTAEQMGESPFPPPQSQAALNALTGQLPFFTWDEKVDDRPFLNKFITDWSLDIGIGASKAHGNISRRILFKALSLPGVMNFVESTANTLASDTEFAKGISIIKQLRDGYKPWEFNYFSPENSAQTVGYTIASAMGLLPANPPYTAFELQNQNLFESALTQAGFVIPAASGTPLLPGVMAAARGGLPTASKYIAPASPVIIKLRNAIKEGNERIAEQQVLQTELKGKKLKKFARSVEEQTLMAEGADFPDIRITKGSVKDLSGELPRLEGLQIKLDAEDMDELYRIIWEKTDEVSKPNHIPINLAGRQVNSVEYLNNMKAFGKVVDAKELPQPAELLRLEKIFGSDMVEDLVSMRSKGDAFFEAFLDGWNLQKAIISSIDISAPGRQGWKLFPVPGVTPYNKEYLKAFAAQFKVLDPIFGKHQYNIIEASIMENKYYDEVKRFMPLMEQTGARRGINNAEDAFISDWASKIPGVQISERAYNTFLNKLRFDSMYKTVDDWNRSGVEYSEVDLQDLANVILWSTGRGSLGPAENHAKLLNALMFSPRFATAPPLFYGSMVNDLTKRALGANNVRHSEVSKIHARILIGHFAKTAGVLGSFKIAEKMYPGFPGEHQKVTIETDPRATDFGKIQIGALRYDFWGGDAQLMKFIARITTGEIKNNAGSIIEADTGKLLEKYLRSKAAPGTSLFYDYAIKKEDFYGNEVRFTQESLKEQAMQRLLFMFAQDIADVAGLQNDSLSNVGFAIPSLLGVGVQAYETADDLRNELAIREHGVLYNDLATDPDGFSKQVAIDRNPMIIQYYVDARERRPAADPTEQWYEGLEANRLRVLELEEGSDRAPDGLIPRLEAGVERGDLRDAIQDHLLKKHLSWLSNIPAHVEEVKGLEKKPILELFRDRYWSITPGIDLRTGTPDFELQQKERAEVLREAASIGIPPHNISTRGPASRNPDPAKAKLINDVIGKYHDDIEYLRVNYWNPIKTIIDESGMKDYYTEYKESNFPGLYTDSNTEQGKQFNDFLNALRILKQHLRTSNQRIDDVLWDYGYTDNIINEDTIERVAQSGQMTEALMEWIESGKTLPLPQ